MNYLAKYVLKANMPHTPSQTDGQMTARSLARNSFLLRSLFRCQVKYLISNEEE